MVSTEDPDQFAAHDETYIFVYDKERLQWYTDRLSWDGIKELEVRGSVITGEAWSAPKSRWMPFQVDLDTKLVTGGAYSEQTR